MDLNRGLLYRQTQQYCGDNHESKVLVNRLGFTKTCFVLVLQGASQNFSTETCFFSITNQNASQNLHRQSETKIAKTSLPGTKPTYVEIKKKGKKVSIGNLHVQFIADLFYVTTALLTIETFFETEF